MLEKKKSYDLIRPRVLGMSLLSAGGLYLGVSYHLVAILVFALNIMGMLFFNTQEIISLMFFLMPFTMIYKINPASTSLFTYLSLCVVLILFYKKRFRLHGTKKYIFILSFLTYAFIGVGSNYTIYIKMITSFLLAIMFTDLIDRTSFPKICILLSLGTVVSGIIGLQKNEWPALKTFFSDLNYETINGVRISRFSALYLDPNYYSILVIACLLSLLIFILLKEINLYIGVSVIAPLLIFGCLTYSKLFYISLTIIVLAFLLILMKNSRHPVWGIVGMTIICIFAIKIAIGKGIVDNILARFDKEDISNNRFYIWSRYLEYILSSARVLLFGEGIGAPYYQMVGPHNTYIEMLYFLGALGSSLYCASISSIIATRKVFFRRSFSNYLMLITFLIEIATLGMLFSNDLIYLVVIVWMVMNTDLAQKIEVIR